MPERRPSKKLTKPRGRRRIATVFDTSPFWDAVLSSLPEPSAVQARADAFAAMRDAGTPPQIVYAFRKTGLLLSENNKVHCSPKQRRAWDAAIEEYFALVAEGEKPDPRAWHSELPEFIVCPLTHEDHDQVRECLRAMDSIGIREMTVLARAELAAVLLASACASAYQSAEEMGVPTKGPAQYASAEELILRRARELYAQGRA